MEQFSIGPSYILLRMVSFCSTFLSMDEVWACAKYGHATLWMITCVHVFWTSAANVYNFCVLRAHNWGSNLQVCQRHKQD